MRTETIVKTIYKFDELPEEAKDKAIEKWRESLDVSFEMQDVKDDAKEIGALFGIDIDKIYYSGFSSQGDGACFEGEYTYRKGGLKAVKEYAPQDTGLHAIVATLQELQKKNFYRLYARVKQRGYYMHENCTNIDVGNDTADVSSDTEESMKDALRDYMRWIYSRLEAAYDYANDEKNIAELLQEDYEFDEDGSLV